MASSVGALAFGADGIRGGSLIWSAGLSHRPSIGVKKTYRDAPGQHCAFNMARIAFLKENSQKSRYAAAIY
jgi:hypothetical protein